ncbi:unnamed protein product [Sphagnum troendelagicum]|uniref:Uncharacterized protein n=1 Tax=Sphagnum troendelagicum TaxID=128251 RepID=A0ABP0TM42_9BRYO
MIARPQDDSAQDVGPQDARRQDNMTLGQQDAGPTDESPRDGSPTDENRQRNIRACVAAVLQRCCSTCRGSVAALLQHASWQRCCSLRRCGTVAIGDAALLQLATMTESNALCKDGKRL